MTPQRSILSLLAILTLCGCAALQAADAPVTLRLSPVLTRDAGPLSPEQVAVAPLRARGFTANNRYSYVSSAEPGAISQARTLFWEEPPTQVVERALVDGLRNRFAAVVGGGVSVKADRRVLTTLTRFEERSGDQASAVVAFEAMMLKGGVVVKSGSWCGAAPIASASPTARAQAFEAAIAQAVGAFVQANDGVSTATRDC